eukprot:gnl/TRDRNA2_/TRDRNA2_177739_c6_seq1.p1 gnl/TRDRNA2_/TRDRNA2_177739_c6~~gnl/TRDRNA2_/TRDRNA2_177739_c6_seq1.p1  ORF type:complete len:500 (-),score=37.33 gnl/TRDRNA2_/TRDRNA2_177739_c6_seq1:81-1580(-)
MRILYMWALLRITVLVSYADGLRMPLRRNEGFRVSHPDSSARHAGAISGSITRIKKCFRIHENKTGTCSMKNIYERPALLPSVTLAETNGFIHDYMQKLELDSTNTFANRLRPVVVGYLESCSDRFGNRIHEFLNALTFAIVANYTFVMNISSDCASFLGQEFGKLGTPLATHAIDVFSFLKIKNPGSSTLSLKHMLTCSGDMTRFFERMSKSRYKNNERIIIDTSRKWFTSGRKYQDQALAAIGAPRLDMSPRARKLFALGPHYAFGALFKASFSWTAAVTSPVLQKLHDAGLIASPEEKEVSSSDDTLLISVQCRHRDPAMLGSEDTKLIMKKITAILSKRIWTQCGILLASDRRVTRRALAPLARQRGCKVVTMTPHDGRTDVEMERGVDEGLVAMQDLYMLSLGDVFIGSFGSTFSFLAQELASARSYSRKGRQAPSVIQCDTQAGLCLRELPLISTNHKDWWYISLQGFPHANIQNSHAEICAEMNNPKKSVRH